LRLTKLEPGDKGIHRHAPLGRSLFSDDKRYGTAGFGLVWDRVQLPREKNDPSKLEAEWKEIGPDKAVFIS
jgi:hypothetical protein